MEGVKEYKDIQIKNLYTMRLTIARVNETLFDGEAYSLTLPTASGEITVLGNHMPLISIVKKGVLRVRENKESAGKEFPVEKGVLEVTPERVTVIL